VVQIFKQPSKRLQNIDTSASELYNIMNYLKTNLTERLEQQLFGAHFISCSQHIQANKYEKYKKIFGKFYENVISYLCKWIVNPQMTTFLKCLNAYN